MSAIDEVKSRLDIVDIVGEHVKLQRAGRNFKALCPFHSEKTPSFTVSPDRQSWHCFGACSTGGDVFGFVMKREGLEFGEALRLLARRAGVELGERRPHEDEQHQRLFQANEAAATFFHHALLNSQIAGPARDYLQARGLDAETIEAFELGYSAESWDTLKSHLLGRGFSQEELTDAGLLVESDRGGYDRFRNRLMFPIRDERGRVAGFGARALEPAEGENSGAPGAKYINTPQSPVFDKSGLLYALDRAKETIRRLKSAIVVEGYMDVIAAHQHGITNVIASMGTALTERQIRTLERFKSKILLAMDADAAGVEATLRALQEAEATGAVRARPSPTHPVELPDEEFSQRVQEWSRDALKRAAVNFYVVPLSGKDPDEMIRKDRDAWEEAVAAGKPFTDHLFDTLASRKDLSLPDQRAALVQELLPVIRLVEEPIYRAHCVQRLAAQAHVSEQVIWAELRRRPARAARGTAEPEAPAAGHAAGRAPGEEFCLALLMRNPELRPQGTVLSPDIFSLGEHKAIFAAWHATDDMESLRQALPESVRPVLDRVLHRDLPILEGSALRAALEDCVRRIELRRLSAHKEASTAALATVPGDVSAAVEEARAFLHQEQELPAPERRPQGDTHRSEMAVALVEDMEVGKRLHHASSRGPVDAPEESPPDEDGS